MRFLESINNINQLDTFIAKIAEFIQDKIVFLNGDLGAGKTTFVQRYASYKGCKVNVSSPTFTIMNSYKFNNTEILHFDIYRINSISELEQTGFFDYIEEGKTVFIEWAAKFDLKMYFDNTVEINIAIDSMNIRHIDISL